MTEEMATIFETLAKPNPEKQTKEERKQKALRSHESWYDLSKDVNQRPSYEFNESTQRWQPYSSGNSNSRRPSVPAPYTPATTTTSTATTKPTTTRASRAMSLFSFSSSSSSSSSSSASSSSSSTSGETKVVVIGNGAVGKTSMLITYTTKSFPSEYVPSAFDSFTQLVMAKNGTVVPLNLWDTAGQEDYDRLRPLSYPGTHVFVIAFSVISPSSLESVKSKWIPEITTHSPGTPAILVGTKTDLRDSPTTLEDLASKKLKPVTKEEAEKFAKEIPTIVQYFECSSLQNKGLDELFQYIADSTLKKLSGTTSAKKAGCAVM